MHPLPRRLPHQRLRRRLHSRRPPLHLLPHHRKPRPHPPRPPPLLGDHVFGCDICQDVCPFNAGDRVSGAPELAPRAGYARPSLTQLLGLGAAQFRKWQRDSALRRIHRPQLLRNVAVALGNVGTISDLPPLMHALGEPWPLVRSHVAWAIAQIVARSELSDESTSALSALLRSALAHEIDPEARIDLESAVAAIDQLSS